MSPGAPGGRRLGEARPAWDGVGQRGPRDVRRARAGGRTSRVLSRHTSLRPQWRGPSVGVVAQTPRGERPQYAPRRRSDDRSPPLILEVPRRVLYQ